jgi:hypothetical protein
MSGGLGRHTPAISKILVRTRQYRRIAIKLHAGVAVLRNCGNGAAVRFGSDNRKLSEIRLTKQFASSLALGAERKKVPVEMSIY